MWWVQRLPNFEVNEQASATWGAYPLLVRLWALAGQLGCGAAACSRALLSSLNDKGPSGDRADGDGLILRSWAPCDVHLGAD